MNEIVTQVLLSQYADGSWECDVDVNEEWVGGGTAPTAEGAFDLAMEIIDSASES